MEEGRREGKERSEGILLCNGLMISRQSKTAKGGCMLVAEIGDQLRRRAGSPRGVYYSHFWKHRISFGIQMIF